MIDGCLNYKVNCPSKGESLSLVLLLKFLNELQLAY